MERVNIKSQKNEIRMLIWKKMEELGISLPPGAYGRIPNFKGAKQAALRVGVLRDWRTARVVKVNPDSPQRWVRELALREGKKLVMPTPRLRRGFLLIDPRLIPSSRISFSATIKGAFRYGKLLMTIDELKANLSSIDLIVEGSVAVNDRGERLGKGEGYGDLEFAILLELGIIEREVPIITTVHDIQLLRERLPQDPHDVAVDYILTPTRVVKANDRPKRPNGLIPSQLSKEKVKEIPLISEMLRTKK
ncbi:MAG: 5-formyltetrahydrofolate cyclo-ligase [Aeropyrum sp.]|nr:5-formyltetrahydrofolate cyclo-ligase [Aeropyrum sp.]MCE4615910.1 5-formyltetrahydrofolate cyclo-ligase [Aeropyrum sp.]